MIKVLFAVILLAHGLLHLLGFAKAFKLGNAQQISSVISRPAGVLWLMVTLLFVVSFFLWLIRHQNWALLCLIAIVLSQLLIFFVWKDAKAGTIANLILLAVAWPEYGTNRFQKMVEQDRNALVSGIEKAPSAAITENDLQLLPPIVQQWLRRSGVLGKPRIHFVQLKQSGKMKLKPGSEWMDFKASQYFNPINPAFVWDTRVEMMRGVFFTGRDKFENGKGYMLVKILSLANLVNEKNNPMVNSGTAQRFLAELCWFPTAALEPYIQWETVDSSSVKATLTLSDQTVDGIFSFLPTGEIASFETLRYYGSGAAAHKERWVINILQHQYFDGYYLPKKIGVTWALFAGNFNWLELEVTDLQTK